MAISPSTDLRLIKCPLEIDEKNQITFASKTAQANYFLSLPHIEINDISYQRKDSTIRFPAHIDSIIEYNYCMYKNDNYSNKWFYAFITNMEYINDNMTLITIKTDTYQTWAFDLEWKQSFIEREMLSVGDDVPGRNIVPENLNTGEYIVNQVAQAEYGGVDPEPGGGVSSYPYSVYVASTVNWDKEPIGGFTHQGNFLGCGLFCFHYPSDDTALKQYIKMLDEGGKADAIVGIFLAPTILGDRAQTIDPTDKFRYSVTYSTVVDKQYINNPDPQYSWANRNITLTTGNIDGYTPKNKKLLCYPYRFLNVSNNNGANIILNYEDFYTISNGQKTLVTPIFEIYGQLSIGCSVRMIPLNYKGIAKNDDEGINLGKFPSCTWQSDVFTNWLTQNAVNIAVDTVKDIASIGVGIATLPEGGGLGIVKGAEGIAKTIGSVYQASLTPPQAKGNLNNGDVITGSGRNDFFFYDKSIKINQAKILDSYFSMFGYKTNEVKIPNLSNRKYWNYVKTVDCNIIADIPQNDLEEIKNMFDNGLTLWHTTSGFLNYSLDNNEALS